MRLTEPRIPTLDEAQWDDEQKELIGRAGEREQTFNIFRTLVRHPKALKRWMVFANHVLFKSTLGAREREIVILRIGWLCRAEYEWAQHVVIGKRAGLTDAEIDMISAGPDAPGWDRFDAALVRAADELHADAIISDETWATLAERYDEQQMIDLVFAIGNYNLVSMMLNTLGVQLDPGLEGFKS